MRFAWLCLIVFAACRTTEQPAPPTCAMRTAELKTLLIQLVDSSATPKPPWPTGDVATDRRIAEARTTARAALVPRSPAQRQPPLREGTTPGLLEHELASCPPALAQLASVGEVAPAERHHAFAAIADRIATCDCHADLPFLSALFYISQRGPD